MMIEKPVRVRSRRHLLFVSKFPCLLCGNREVQVHHLTHAQPKGRGLKASDAFVVPLCVRHHSELHLKGGRERNFWENHNIDAIEYSQKLWKLSCEETNND